jgi:hypothetical protein
MKVILPCRCGIVEPRNFPNEDEPFALLLRLKDSARRNIGVVPGFHAQPSHVYSQQQSARRHRGPFRMHRVRSARRRSFWRTEWQIGVAFGDSRFRSPVVADLVGRAFRLPESNQHVCALVQIKHRKPTTTAPSRFILPRARRGTFPRDSAVRGTCEWQERCLKLRAECPARSDPEARQA